MKATKVMLTSLIWRGTRYVEGMCFDDPIVLRHSLTSDGHICEAKPKQSIVDTVRLQGGNILKRSVRR